LGTITGADARGSKTVLEMLEHAFSVSTRYVSLKYGKSVEAIGGHAGGSGGLKWSYYVNGIGATVGPSLTPVYKGDRIWWDLHDSSAAGSVPAVVGSFPEPFVHGIGGRRLPTVLECSPDEQSACNRIATELQSFGVPISDQAPGTGSGTDSLSILVGTWPEIDDTVVSALMEKGPAASGIYARFGDGGATLELLGPAGQVARTLGPGAGLVAASSQSSAEPTWIVTGTDTAGVAAAAAAMTASRLDNHFALAIDGSTDLPVPQDGGS
jgi:hypothetical protein